MARGRMLNKTVSLSLKFHDLPDDTCRLLATWTITQLDYRGVFYADPAVVKSMVFPRRTDITIDDVAHYLDAMQEAGLILLFEVHGQLWQSWPGFAHNQIGLRAERESTEYPPPPGEAETASPPEGNESPQDDGNLPDDSRKDAAEKPAEGEDEVEVKLREKKEKGAADAAKPPSPPPKPKKRKAKPKTPIPRAVQVFRENAHRYPPKSWYARVADTVGEKPDDLERWGELVLTWVGRGYNPTNVAGMLDAFSNGGLQSQKGGKDVKRNERRPKSAESGKAAKRQIETEQAKLAQQALAQQRKAAGAAV